MGMFDWVDCEYPLPDGAPTVGYQTKDTPAQYLERYLITEDGRLVNERGEAQDFHGDVNFYHSNVCGSGPKGYITDDNKQATFWDFVARFTDGRVTRLTGGQVEPDGHYRGPPMTHEAFHKPTLGKP